MHRTLAAHWAHTCLLGFAITLFGMIDSAQSQTRGSVGPTGSNPKAGLGGAAKKEPRGSIGAEVFDYNNSLSRCNFPIGYVGKYPAKKRNCRNVRVRGVLVGRLDKNGSMHSAGLRTGDVISGALIFDNRNWVKILRLSSVKDIASLLGKYYANDKVYLQYFIPLRDTNKSQHWRRNKYAALTIPPKNAPGTLVSVKRTNSIEEIIATEKASFDAQMSIKLESDSSAKDRLFKKWTVKPYSKKELAAYDSKNSIVNSPKCQKNGAYPNIPKIFHPKGYKTKNAVAVKQIKIVDEYGNSVVGLGSAAASVGNAIALREKAAGAVAKARWAFWGKMNKGIYDENLRNEYSIWLEIGWKFRAPRGHGAMKVFNSLVTRSTAGEFSYPLGEPNKHVYQFLKYSNCSLLKSEYLPDHEVGKFWLARTEGANVWTYEQARKRVNAELNKGEIRRNSDDVVACARWTLTVGKSIDACLDATDESSPLVFEKTGENSFRLNLLESTYKQTFLSIPSRIKMWTKSEKERSFYADSIKFCKLEVGQAISRYFFYVDPGNSGIGNNAFVNVCKVLGKNGRSIDVQDDLFLAYVSEQIQYKKLRPDYWKKRFNLINWPHF